MKVLTVPQSFIKKGYCVKNFLHKPNHVAFNPVKLSVAFDKVVFKPRNTITMKQDEGKLHFSFYEGNQKIGYAVFGESNEKEAILGSAPIDWFVPIIDSNNIGPQKLKPYIYINEIVIDDRVGLTGEYSQRKSGKKYGTMSLQKILEWAKNHGYGTRLSLAPGKTHSDIEPNKFYTKVGFEMSPNDIKMIEALESKYEKEACYFNRRKNEKIDGRWLSRGQTLFLTHPEILENYPLN